jgi:flagellum-specific peptidoglycan hydrolase FlgJ
MGTANAAEAGPEQAPSQQPPYRYDGPEVEGITVTGKPSTIPLNVYPHQGAFFDRFDEPVTRLAKQYELDPEHLLGLFGHESDWGRSKDAITNNNPFGLNLPGSTQLRPFPSIDTGMEYWGKMYGEQLRGIHKTEDFANKLLNLRAGAYNSVDPDYRQKVTNNIHTVNVKRPLWRQGR